MKNIESIPQVGRLRRLGGDLKAATDKSLIGPMKEANHAVDSLLVGLERGMIDLPLNLSLALGKNIVNALADLTWWGVEKTVTTGWNVTKNILTRTPFIPVITRRP